MAYYLTELYTAKPAWLELSQEDRQRFFSAIGSGMPALSALGVEPITLGQVDHSKLHSASQTFFAVWRCPDDAALEVLVLGIAQSGWHAYFDTVNADGQGTDLAGHLGQLAEAA